MSSYFPTVTDAPLSATAKTEEFVASSPIVFAIASGQTVTAHLEKNGVSSGQAVSLIAGDRVVVAMEMGVNYSAASHVKLRVNDEQDDWVTFVTLDDPTVYVDPAFATGELPAVPVDVEGNEFLPSPADNRAMIYSASGLLDSLIAEVDISGPASSSGTNDQATTMDVVSYYDRYLHRVNAQTGERVSSLLLPYRPWKSVRVPVNSSNLGLGYETWITCPEQHCILVVSPGNAIARTIDMSNGGQFTPGPKGIAVSPNGNRVAIGCYNSQNLMHYNRATGGGTWVGSSTGGSFKIADLVMSNNGIVWGVHPEHNQIVSLALNESSTVNIPVTGAWSRLAYNEATNTLLAVSAADNRRIMFVRSLARGTQAVSYLNTEAFANSFHRVAVNPADGSWYVWTKHTNKLYRLPAGTSTAPPTAAQMELVRDLDPATQEILFRNGNFIEINQWDDLPPPTYTLDRHPDDFDLGIRVKAPPGTVMSSDTVTVRGINTSCLATVVPEHDASLWVNGVNRGLSYTVRKNDEVFVQFRNPSESLKEFYVTLFIGSTAGQFYGRTTESDDTIKPVLFADVTNAALLTEYVSNVVTIEGITEDIELAVLASAGTLVINGQDAGTQGTVRKGDTLAIKMFSLESYGAPTSCQIFIGGFEEIWTVHTRSDPKGPAYFMDAATSAGLTIRQMIPTPPAGNRRVRRLSSTGQVLNDWDMLATPQQNGASGEKVTYALDPWTSRTYQVDTDPSSGGVEAALAVQYGFGICAAPLTGTSEDPTVHYQTIFERDVLIKLGTDETIALPAGSRPMGVAVNNKNRMFVACANGLLVMLEQNASGRYVLQNIISIPGGGRLCHVLVSGDTVYVSDLSSGQIHRLVNGFYMDSIPVGLLPYAVCMTDSRIYAASFGDNTIATFTKSDPQNVRMLTLPADMSQPVALAASDALNKVYVSTLRSNDIFVSDSELRTVQPRIALGHYVSGMIVDGTDLLAYSLWDINMGQQYGIGRAQIGPASIPLPAIEEAEPGEVYKAQQYTFVGNTVRPVRVWVEDFEEVTLYRNGIPAGNNVADFSRGDRMDIEVRSLGEYAGQRKVGVFWDGGSTQFSITNKVDRWPDSVIFGSQDGIVLKSQVTTENVEVSGMTDGWEEEFNVKTTTMDTAYADVRIVKNGVVQPGPSAMFKNGDSVGITLVARGITWGGALIEANLYTTPDYVFGVFQGRTGFLNGVIKDEKSNQEESPEPEFTVVQTWDRPLTWIGSGQAFVPGMTYVKALGMDAASWTAKNVRGIEAEIDYTWSMRAEYKLTEEDAQWDLGVGTKILSAEESVGWTNYRRLASYVTINSATAETIRRSTVVEIDQVATGVALPRGSMFAVLTDLQIEVQSASKIVEGPEAEYAKPVAGHKRPVSMRFEKFAEHVFYVSRPVPVWKPRHDAVTVRAEYLKGLVSRLPTVNMRQSYRNWVVGSQPQVLAQYAWDAVLNMKMGTDATWVNRPRFTILPVSITWVNRPRYTILPVDLDWTVAPRRTKVNVETEWTTVRRRTVQTTVSDRPEAVAGKRMPSIKVMSERAGVMKRSLGTYAKVTTQFAARVSVVHPTEQYTFSEIRSYDTPEAAVIAAQAEGHADANTRQLFDGSYYWNVDALIQRVTCPVDDGDGGGDPDPGAHPMPLSGYMQGG